MQDKLDQQQQLSKKSTGTQPKQAPAVVKRVPVVKKTIEATTHIIDDETMNRMKNYLKKKKNKENLINSSKDI